MDKLGSEAGEDPRVEAGIRCLVVSSFLAWGLSHANHGQSLGLAVGMLEFWGVEVAISARGSSEQHFRWRSGEEETRRRES